jgi:hypothetical protein
MLARKVSGVVFAAMLLAAPLAHVGFGSVHSMAVPAWPPFQAEHYRSGAVMRFTEIWFDAATPASAWLRGGRRNLWWQLGLFESKDVHIGKDGWLFAEQTLHMDEAAFAAAASGRRAFLEALRQRCESLGVALVAVPVPDKSSVYTDWLASEDVRDPAKAGLYGRIVTEFRQAGIATVDLGEAFGAPKRSALAPDEAFGGDRYYARDTHWGPRGMSDAAREIVARLQQWGIHDRLDTPVHYDEDAGQDGVPNVVLDERLPDLVSMLGLPGGGAIEQSLRHAKFWMTVTIDGDEPDRRQPTASLAVCGDSFAFKGLFWPLALASGQLVDSVGCVPARGPFVGLLETLHRLEQGDLQAKVVVWAFIERSFLRAWQNPPALR